MADEDPVPQPEYSGGGDDHPPKTAIGTEGGADWNDLLSLAEEEAQQRGDRLICTDLFLIAILRTHSTASTSLQSRGLSLQRLRERLGRTEDENSLPLNKRDSNTWADSSSEDRGLFSLDCDSDSIFADTAKQIPLSSQAQAALSFAWEEAAELYDIRLRPEHLLLAVLRRQGCLAQILLSELNVEPSHLRTEILGNHDGWR